MEMESGSTQVVSMVPGAVRLRVADLPRAQEFYERAVGLGTIDCSDDLARLGTDGMTAVELEARRDAERRPPRTTGLFHLAILVPDRAELARALVRVANAGWRLSGASDHLVSEALYLSDPEDNGIEIYRDRPRSEWQYGDGDIRMSTLPLDLDGLLADARPGEPQPEAMPAGTRIGHVHLNVADLGEAEAFYSGLLGFDVTVRGYPGALFLAKDGYHHHIGVNTWAGHGASVPPETSRGLEWYELIVDGPEELARLEQRLGGAGVEVKRVGDELRTRDPSGNGVLLKPAGRSTLS
jgi:catechol 2,3-dioxygenase